MAGSDRLVHYLSGVPEPGPGVPAALEVPQVYRSEQAAREQLSVMMTLAAMVQGDAVANAASWYLLTADTSAPAALGEEEAFHGYLLDDTVYPLAGGWIELFDAYEGLPFVVELERRRAHRAGLPWQPDMINQFSLETCRPTCDIDYSFFRFTPLSSELLVRPLHVYVTEPLF
jgi:hypothetical protein